MKSRSVIAFFCLVLISSCNREDLSNIDNLNAGRIEVIGHGGSGFTHTLNSFQPNSWPSIIRATDALLADGVEVDVQITIDSALVLYHDHRLEETTDCYGYVSDRSSAEVFSCRYNNGVQQNEFSSLELVKLQELLARYSTYENPPLIALDIKLLADFDLQPQNWDAFVSQLVSLINQYNATAHTVVVSTNIDFLMLVRNEGPAVRLWWDANDIDPILDEAVTNGIEGFSISNSHITKEQVKKCHAAGLKVYLFNVRSQPGHEEAIGKHPDGIMSDNILLAQQILFQLQD